MDILIKGGTLVSSEFTKQTDILIRDGKIETIGIVSDFSDQCFIIEAKDKYVIPGAIDPHVHMQLPTPAGASSDDFYTGSIAALYGGTTTILDFVTPSKGQSMVNALELRKKEAEKSIVDFSFHVSPIEWRNSTADEILECVRLGITSFKVYLAYKNYVGLNYDDFFEVLKVVGNAGGLVTIHCEDGDDVEDLRSKFANENMLSPLYHCKSRPAALEAKAVKRSIELAKKANCAIYIVHVSTHLSLKYIAEAQQNGQTVYAETCPHYLLLDDSRYNGNFRSSVPFVISPPLRKKDDQNALWEALQTGIIQTVGTDHCPFNYGQKAIGINDFRKIPNGAGGVEHRLSLLFTYGVLQNKISLNQWVNLCSTQPAKIFGLFPTKGEIAKGSDADVIIWNPNTENIISTKTHHQNCDLEIFEGLHTKGAAEIVIKAGEIVIEDGSLKSFEKGKFISR